MFNEEILTNMLGYPPCQYLLIMSLFTVSKVIV